VKGFKKLGAAQGSGKDLMATRLEKLRNEAFSLKEG